MIVSTLLVMLAKAVAPEALTPEGTWQLDEPSCVLSRNFRSAAGTVTFGIKPSRTSTGGELVLVLPGRTNGRYEVDEGSIVIGDGGKSFPAVWSRVGRRDQTFNGVTVQPADGFWKALPAATALTIDVGKRQKVRFELGTMSGAIAALERCRAEKISRTVAARR